MSLGREESVISTLAEARPACRRFNNTSISNTKLRRGSLCALRGESLLHVILLLLNVATLANLPLIQWT